MVYIRKLRRRTKPARPAMTGYGTSPYGTSPYGA